MEETRTLLYHCPFKKKTALNALMKHLPTLSFILYNGLGRFYRKTNTFYFGAYVFTLCFIACLRGDDC